MPVKAKTSFAPDPLPENKIPAHVRWNQRYARMTSTDMTDVSPLLAAQLANLPRRGHALDIAAGAGRHSIALAQNGLMVDAVDISVEGLRLLKARAGPDLPICPLVIDLSLGWLPERCYDVIVNFFFLERAIWPQMENRLAPGGWLIFETFTVGQLALPNKRPVRRAFLLEENELRHAFPELKILFYQEGIYRGKATARMVARKPDG